MAGYYGFILDVHPSVVHPSVCLYFAYDNLSKYQCMVTKLGMCIDIVEILFGIANGQILSNFDGVICPRHIFVSWLITQVNISGFSPNGMCIDIVELWFGIAIGRILSNFDGVICPRHIFISRS